MEKTPTVQALRSDAKKAACIPWKDNKTMMTVMHDAEKVFALVKYAVTQKISLSTPQADFMKTVFDKNFRYHLLNYK